ncbi:MAG: hypothetical protein JW900_01515 [Anaerolineae bacterium]|nr:hypothetical protein [Anaerolineae bacterium]
MDGQELEAQETARPPELTIAAQRLKRDVVGDEFAIGGRHIQPLAQMTGWYGSDAHARAGVAWAWLRLRPTGVQVREADGQETLVPIEDATGAALRGIALVGLVTAVICWFIMLVKRRQ